MATTFDFSKKLEFPIFEYLSEMSKSNTKNFNFLTIKNTFLTLKDVGDDNWALFYTLLSEVSEKPGFRNN
jgi:hypothetical protein